MTENTILEGVGLEKTFGSARVPVRAVDGVTLGVRKGETFAIVGESGCGKSTLARLLLRLIEPTKGEVRFEGRRINGLPSREMQALRARMQLVFQDPFASLNPRMTAGAIVGEPLWLHKVAAGRAARRERVAELFRLVGLPPEHAGRYPHEFSGGQRQRLGIARALACEPDLVIGDEPVSALDVSVQAQIVNLLEELRERLGLTLVIVSHGLPIIRHMSDRVAVMYAGEIVELAPADDLFDEPLHPYTRALLAAVPRPRPRPVVVAPIEGDMPNPAAPPPGCRFHPRCPHARERCRHDRPALEPAGEDRQAACHFWREIRDSGAGPSIAAASDAPSAALARRLALFEAGTSAALTRQTSERGGRR